MPSSKAKVTLFGEVLADEFLHSSIIGGAPYNVARHLQGFGIIAHLISRIGQDELGERIKYQFNQAGLSIAGLQTDHQYASGRVRVMLDTDSHRFEIMPEQAYDYIDVNQASAFYDSNSSPLLYFGTLAQREATSRAALYALLDMTSATRFLDLNLRAPWYDKTTIHSSLMHTDIVKMNESELEVISSVLEIGSDNRNKQIGFLFRTFKLQQIILTLGANGAIYYDNQGREIHAQVSQELSTGVIDTVGAGDAFSAVWLMRTLLGWPVHTALVRANQFASAICAIQGATPSSQHFYQPFVGAWEIEQ